MHWVCVSVCACACWWWVVGGRGGGEPAVCAGNGTCKRWMSGCLGGWRCAAGQQAGDGSRRRAAARDGGHVPRPGPHTPGAATARQLRSQPAGASWRQPTCASSSGLGSTFTAQSPYTSTCAWSNQGHSSCLLDARWLLESTPLGCVASMHRLGCRRRCSERCLDRQSACWGHAPWGPAHGKRCAACRVLCCQRCRQGRSRLPCRHGAALWGWPRRSAFVPAGPTLSGRHMKKMEETRVFWGVLST